MSDVESEAEDETIKIKEKENLPSEDEQEIDDDQLEEEDEDEDDEEFLDEEELIKEDMEGLNKIENIEKDIVQGEEALISEFEDPELNITPINSDLESDEDEEESNLYLDKFDKKLRENYIQDFHPESININFNEVEELCKIERDSDGMIIDENHTTIPFLTKYEKTRVLGIRAKQINKGNKPFIEVPENIIDGYLIAQLELKEKKLPFIICRPLPNNKKEYWRINDLEII